MRRMKDFRGQNRDALGHPQNLNHSLHMLLTLLSFGLWLPVWLGLTIAHEGWKSRYAWVTAGKSIKGMTRINRLDISPEMMRRLR